MERWKFITMALISTTLVGLEIIWTRIFSAEFFYTFAFLILSLAVLGLGLGALTLHLFPGLNRGKLFGIYLSLIALFTLIGPPLVFRINMDFTELFSNWGMIGKLLLVLILLSSSFWVGGMALALLFKSYHRRMPKLYMFDLIGAGFGVILAILLMNQVGTPLATFLIAIPCLMAALLNSQGWMKGIPLLILLLVIPLSLKSDRLIQQQREERAPVVLTHWDAMAKIKLYEPTETYQQLNIDNVAHTGTIKFDGNWDRPDSLKFDFSINIKELIEQFHPCTYLVIGAGGGVDVVQPLHAGVSEIHAVEVIPYLNDLLVDGQLAEFSGYIYNDPRVKVVTEDARSYIRRFKNKFDLIYSSSSNTFAAMASGAFSMAENYLFTTEAFQDYWNALSDSGYMILEHQVYMPRVVSELMTALAREGVNDIPSRFAVYNWPGARRNVLLLSKRPLNSDVTDYAITGGKPLEGSPFYLLHPAADSVQNNLIQRIVIQGWEANQDSAQIDISPTSDNRPFIAQMGLWRNFEKSKLDKVIPYSDLYGFPLSQMIILILLGVVLFFIIPLNLLPYLVRGPKLRKYPWLYFFTIGAAFMMVEVVLIQKYTLFIGASLYSTVTVLLTLLVGSGIGSYYSPRIKTAVIFSSIVGLLILDILILPKVVSLFTNLPMLMRALIVSGFLFPVSFFMGMPFPKGSEKVGALIDWGFAVNGAASVLGSVLVVLVSFNLGFSYALLSGAFLYTVAFLLIRNHTAWLTIGEPNKQER